MNRMTYPNMDRSLSDKAYDFLGEMILEAETQEMLEEIKREQEQGNTAEMDAFFAMQDKRNLQRIHKYFRKEHYRHLLTQTLPKLVRVAAIVIAVISLAGSVAVAASHTVRVKVMQLLSHMEEEYTVVHMVEDEEASFDVPAEWKGTSYMSYLPENLVVGQIFSYVDNDIVEFRDRDTNKLKLQFSEVGISIWAQIDTQNAKTEQVVLNNYTAIFVDKGSMLCLYWCDGRKLFILTQMDGTREELFEVAKSVKKLN